MSAAPPGRSPVVLVAAAGDAEGSLAAAAALACAGSVGDPAPLLVDVEGRAARPTLLASAAAQRLERRLGAHLPGVRPVARGQLCQLVVAAEPEGLIAAAAAVTVARGAPAVVHVGQPRFRDLLEAAEAPSPTAVLLRADVRSDRALLGLLVPELRERGLAVAVLKRRLGWVAERRALFGALPLGAAALPGRLVARLLGEGAT